MLPTTSHVHSTTSCKRQQLISMLLTMALTWGSAPSPNGGKLHILYKGGTISLRVDLNCRQWDICGGILQGDGSRIFFQNNLHQNAGFCCFVVFRLSCGFGFSGNWFSRNICRASLAGIPGYRQHLGVAVFIVTASA